MPLVDITTPTTQDILAQQGMWGLSDRAYGMALLGPVRDPAKIVRAWKSGIKEPTNTVIRAFVYLRALANITAQSPLDGEEIFAIAHDALPDEMK